MNIIDDPREGMLIRSMAAKLRAVSASEYLFADFLTEIEPKKVSEALKHSGWVDAMQEELNQFHRNKVSTLVPPPYGKIAIGSKWEEGINYDETFAPVERMEAIRIFLISAKYMNFIVFQIDVKSVFLNGKLKEEVYVKKPHGFESSEFPDYVCKLDKALYGLKQAPRACSSVKNPMVPPNNLRPDVVGKLVCWSAKKQQLVPMSSAEAEYVAAISVIAISNNLCIAIASDPKPPVDNSEARPLKEFIIKFTVMNGKKPLTLDFKTLFESTRLNYNQRTYVSHPSPEAVKVLSGNYLSNEQVNSIQQLLAYCLLTRTKVDIGEIIYSDLVTRITSKSRQKHVSYTRFVSCAIKVLLGTEYTQDQKFRSLPNVLSNSNFTKDPSNVTLIELTALMIAVNNLESLVSLITTSGKKKKKKSQTVSQPKPKTQGPKASGALPQNRKNPKTQKTPIVQATKTPPTEKVPTKDSNKTQPVSSGQTAHPQDTEGLIQPVVNRSHSPLDEGTLKSKPLPKGKPTDAKDPKGNIQPASVGFPSIPLDEGTSKSKPLLEGKTTYPKNSEGNKQPVNMGLPSIVPDEGISKTKPLQEGANFKDKESERFKPLADMESSTPTVDALLRTNDAVKDDPALNKKVLEATEAYTKNFMNLTELLTLVKTFDYSSLKFIVESLKAVMDAQNDHLAKWAKTSTPSAVSCLNTSLAITKERRVEANEKWREERLRRASEEGGESGGLRSEMRRLEKAGGIRREEDERKEDRRRREKSLKGRECRRKKEKEKRERRGERKNRKKTEEREWSNEREEDEFGREKRVEEMKKGKERKKETRKRSSTPEKRVGARKRSSLEKERKRRRRKREERKGGVEKERRRREEERKEEM
ncbi:retrovirus-related pol polyprotein from transposon TNT 1-94 [Tanacetum coccineum]